MRHKVYKAIIATLLTVSMLGTTCFAQDMDSAGTDTSVSGSNKLQEPIYKVVIPTDLTFGIDAFEQKGEGQIYSSDLTCVNKSNVPVKVTVKLSAAVNDGKEAIDFETNADAVGTAETDRSLYLEAEIAKTVTETKAVGAAYAESVDMVFRGDKYYKDNSTMNVYDGTSSESGTVKNTEMEDVTGWTTDYTDGAAFAFGGDAVGSFSFALQKSEYINYVSAATDAGEGTISQAFKTTAADGKSSASFQLSGKVNPNIVWAEDDFKVTAVYNFRGVVSSDFDNIALEAGNHQLCALPTPLAFSDNSGTAGVISWTGNEETVNAVTKVILTMGSNEFDLSQANSLGWSAAAADYSAKTYTLDYAGIRTAMGGGADQIEVVVHYTVAGDAVERTADVTVNLTTGA